MQALNLNNPSERNKFIAAIVLGIVAILFLWWTFFGFGGSSKPATPSSTGQNPGPATRPGRVQVQPQTAVEVKEDVLAQLRPVVIYWSPPTVPEARRNIFAFYEPPVREPAPSVIPSPTPTPTPPLLLAAVSPSNVYARTGDFNLEVTGDRFTPQVRILIDGREVPTRYLGPQQLSTTVPAAIIASPGSRQILVRSVDNELYSNPAVISVTPPPTPNYNYIGIIGTKRFVDTAIVLDKSSREVLNVQRGDVLSGRFRVTSISEKELVLIDNNLKIRHTLTLNSEGGADRSFTPPARPTPRVVTEDDEP